MDGIIQRLSAADILINRRRWALMRLGQLFAEIDGAFARGDFRAAQAMAPEVADLLQEVDRHIPRDGPSQTTGVRRRSR